MRRSLRAGQQITPQLLAPVIAAALTTLLAFSSVHAGATESASPWHKTQFSKARLLGARQRANGVEQTFAGVEIVMDKGWKTYWRHPGDAGGVPPSFNWSDSTNIKAVKVLYPAPQRFRDFAGSTIGYKSRVIFPVRITPIHADKPVELKLNLQYGICSSICVPVSETLSFEIPTTIVSKLPPALDDTLAQVPRTPTHRQTSDPVLKAHRIDLDGSNPQIVLDVAFAGQPTGADAFVEVTGNIYLPMARPRPNLGDGIFAIDLSRVNVSKLKGQTLTVTLVSSTGQSVTQFKID